MTQRKCIRAHLLGNIVVSALATALLTNAPLFAAWQQPAASGATVGQLPYQNLIRARQLVTGITCRVQNLISRAGGMSRGGGNPRLPGYPGRIGAMVEENDNAALFALQGMGSALFQLGTSVDQMTAAYGTPMFFGYWQQSCQMAGGLLLANQAAKVAAELPVVGMVTPNDFVPNDVELNAVRGQLWCP